MAEVPKKKNGGVEKRILPSWIDPDNDAAKIQKQFDILNRVKLIDLTQKSPEILTIPENAWQIAIATQEILLGDNTSGKLYYLDQNLAVVARYTFDFKAPKTDAEAALDKWHDDKRLDIKANNPHVLIDTDLELPFPLFTVPPGKRIMNLYERAKQHKDLVLASFTKAFDLTDFAKYLSPAMRKEFIKTCIYGQVATESGWNPKAKSEKNARGILQVLPETASKTAERNSTHMATLGIDPKKIDLYDPSTCSKIAALYYNKIFTTLKGRFDLIQKEFGYTDKKSFDRNLVIPFLFAAYHGGENKIAEMIDWFMSPQNLPAHKKVVAGFKYKSDLHFYITKQFYYRHEVPMGAQGKKGLFGRRSLKYAMAIEANRRLMEAEEKQRAKQVSFVAGETTLGFMQKAAKHTKIKVEGQELEALAVKVESFLKATRYNAFNVGDEIEVGKDDKGIFAKLVLWQFKDVDKRVTRHWIRFRPVPDKDILDQLNQPAVVPKTPTNKKVSPKKKTTSPEKASKWRWKKRNFHTTGLYRGEYSKLVKHTTSVDKLRIIPAATLLKRGEVVEFKLSRKKMGEDRKGNPIYIDFSPDEKDFAFLPMSSSKPYVRPYTLYVMRKIAADFKKASGGYRLLVSSLFRTPKGQRKLAEHNRVATKGTSTHFFGNTFDFTINRLLDPNDKMVYISPTFKKVGNRTIRIEHRLVQILDKILVRYQKKSMAMGYWERPARHVIAAKPKNL